MRVLVTGATGFVGSWTVRALLAAGHEVAALVRDPEKAERVLERSSVDRRAVTVHRGDILDRASIATALDGCQGAVHTAAAIGMTGPRVSVEVQNVIGTRNVVDLALAAGCDPVVHVSSIGVFIPPDGPVITTESRLAAPRNEYGRSKVQSERELRALQDGGAPIAIVYPGAVFGPEQPSLGTTMEGLVGARRTGWPMAPGGVCVIDVRDVAAVLTALVVPGQGARRVLAGGRFVTWSALGDLTDEILGVRARRLPLPKPVIIATGSFLDLLRRRFTVRYPLSRDAAEIMVTMVPTDDAPSLDPLGVTPRPIEETFTDSLRWLVEEGHLTGRAAGRFAASAPG